LERRKEATPWPNSGDNPGRECGHRQVVLARGRLGRPGTIAEFVYRRTKFTIGGSAVTPPLRGVFERWEFVQHAFPDLEFTVDLVMTDERSCDDRWTAMAPIG
jgi:hypothetical protein